MELDWSARGWARVYAFTVLGTAACIAFAFAFDSFSFTTGTWQWGSDPINNLVIPLLIAPPFFFVLLNKTRQLAIAHHELLALATTDSLTSLLNRRAFTEMVDGFLKKAAGKASAPSDGALLVIDVDHFKVVNDRFGHDSGDEALKLIAKAISSSVRETDLVGRMGGEEFGVFMPGQSPEHVRIVAERIRSAVKEAAFVARGERHSLSVSVGGVLFDRRASFMDLYQEADERLYCAKRTGRNRVELCTFSPNATIPSVVY
jgi:diguanylate cyclase (GGDEF)-like protein